MGENLEFGEPSLDEVFKPKLLSFRKDLESASKMLDTFLAHFNYNELSLEDKVRYNLFLAFAINSYFWMYLRIKGIDPNQHDIKEQIDRIRKYMNRSKKIYERKTIMPKIDQGAAKRFVRNGLWTPENSNKTKSKSPEAEAEADVPLKRKKKDPEG